jgi:hypothetical protein
MYSDQDLEDVTNEILLGEWIKGKSPSSVAIRRALAQFVRFLRADMPTGGTFAERQKHLKGIREFYRQHRPAAIEVESSMVELRARMLPAFLLMVMPQKGGIQ